MFHDVSLLLALRLLLQKVGPLFTSKGMIFKVEYVMSVRNWFETIPKISTLYDAYRRATKKDDKVVPHSFTFIRRECSLPWYGMQCACCFKVEAIMLVALSMCSLAIE